MCVCTYIPAFLRAAVPNTRPPAVARRPGRKGGAYIGQRGDRRGVPRADVRVERRRVAERLRAEPAAVDPGGKALARFGADAWPLNRTRTRARTRTHTCGACTPMPASHSSIHIRICI